MQNCKPLTSTDKVAGCHNFMAALFDSLTIQMNGQIVSKSDTLYSYQKHIIDTLSHGINYKNSKLQMQLYYPDNCEDFTDTSVPFVTRMNYFKQSKICELIGNFVATNTESFLPLRG